MAFSDKILHWYHLHKRDLPWRKISDPYHIWLSEIILQQTRVEQGMSYYHKFVTHFPAIFDLARAEEEEVLKLWQGLGYYSRARNLHIAAKSIVEMYGGNFPKKFEELKKLKGIGDYTASAISSICFQEPHAVVDGNVYRVLARVFGIKTPIDSSLGIKEFKKLAQDLIDHKNPGEYNQAVMEFGALHCKPSNPDCEQCMFIKSCYAYQNDEVKLLPVKGAKTKVTQKHFHYLVLISEDKKTRFEKRTSNGIWKNMYQFPLVETEDNLPISEETAQTSLGEIPVKKFELFSDKVVVHKLSHQHLFVRFYKVHTASLGNSGISFEEIIRYPVPVVLQNFISELQLESDQKLVYLN